MLIQMISIHMINNQGWLIILSLCRAICISCVGCEGWESIRVVHESWGMRSGSDIYW